MNHNYSNQSASPLLFFAGLALGAILGPVIKRKLDNSDKLNDFKDQMRTKYEQVVDEVADKYARAKGISKNELVDLTDDMKMHWGRIKQAWNE